MCGRGPNGSILSCSWFHSHTEMNQVSGSPSAIAFVMCTVLLINLYMLQFCYLTLSQSVCFLRLVILVAVLLFVCFVLFFFKQTFFSMAVLAYFLYSPSFFSPRKNLWCVRALKAEQHLIRMIFLQRCTHI